MLKSIQMLPHACREYVQREVDMISGSYTMSDLIHGQNDRPRIEMGGAFSPGGGELLTTLKYQNALHKVQSSIRLQVRENKVKKERCEIEIPNLRRPKSFSGRFNCRARPLLPRAYIFLQQPRSLWMRCGPKTLGREIL